MIPRTHGGDQWGEVWMAFITVGVGSGEIERGGAFGVQNRKPSRAARFQSGACK